MKFYITFIVCFNSATVFASSHTNYTSADLQTSLTNSSLVAGDIEWIAAGTYFPPMRISQLSGTNIPLNGFGWLVTVANSSSTMVEFRSLPGQVAKIDRPFRFTNSGGIRFFSLEFYDSLKVFNPGNPGFSYPAPWIHFDSNGGYANEFVNCIIHDVNDCFGGLAGAIGVRGCVSWYVGSYYYEHFIYPYCTNLTGSINMWTSGSVMQIGPEGGLLNVSSNIVSGTAILGHSVGNEQPEFLLSYGGTFSDNNIFEIIGGNYTALVHNGGTIRAHRNKIAAHVPISAQGAQIVSITNNDLYMDGFSSTFYVLARLGDSTGSWTVNANNYYSIGAVHFNNTNTSRTFTQWKSDYSTFDTTSTSSDSSVPSDSISVIQNVDDSKRLHIAVFNYSLADNVTVNVSSYIPQGCNYYIKSAQNYNGLPVKSGTFTGNTISIPMTNLVSAPILYGSLAQPAVTSPTFGAFVLIASEPPQAIIANGTIVNAHF